MNLARARRDLEFLIGYWPDLAESRIPGTGRYWLTGRRRARASAVAHQAGAHPADALEPQPTPVHIDILDTLADLTMWADETSEAIAQQLGHDRLPHATSAYADPRPHLHHIAAHLGQVDDPDTLADQARDHARRIAHLLGIAPFGLTLDCRCPWCLTDRSLLVQEATDHWYITCTSGICEPPENACGTWRHGRPCWPDWEFEWLARHIERVAS